jgi:hypothetical protein
MEEDRLIKICEDIASIKTDLKNAIESVTGHIEQGTKWRLTIVVACIGLVGMFVGAIVRFSVMEYKVCNLQTQQIEMRSQIYDLNYVKGRTEGLAERK